MFWGSRSCWGSIRFLYGKFSSGQEILFESFNGSNKLYRKNLGSSHNSK